MPASGPFPIVVLTTSTNKDDIELLLPLGREFLCDQAVTFTA